MRFVTYSDYLTGCEKSTMPDVVQTVSRNSISGVGRQKYYCGWNKVDVDIVNTNESAGIGCGRTSIDLVQSR